MAKRLIDGDVEGITLTAVAVRDADKARKALPQIGDLIALRSVVPDFSTVTLQSSVVQPQPGTAAPVQFRVVVGLRNPGGTP